MARRTTSGSESLQAARHSESAASHEVLWSPALLDLLALFVFFSFCRSSCTASGSNSPLPQASSAVCVAVAFPLQPLHWNKGTQASSFHGALLTTQTAWHGTNDAPSWMIEARSLWEPTRASSKRLFNRMALWFFSYAHMAPQRCCVYLLLAISWILNKREQPLQATLTFIENYKHSASCMTCPS